MTNAPTFRKLKEYIDNGRRNATGKVFEDFNLKDSTGITYNLSKAKGKSVTLVVFWASWCAPCRAEIPELKEINKRYHQKGLNIISISLDDYPEDWQRVQRQEQMPWLSLSNLPAKSKDIKNQYLAATIPLMYLLDKDNKIIVKSIYLDMIKRQLTNYAW